MIVGKGREIPLVELYCIVGHVERASVNLMMMLEAAWVFPARAGSGLWP